MARIFESEQFEERLIERFKLTPSNHVRRQLKVYADVEVPVFQNFTGNQIAAPLLFKTTVSWAF